MRNENTTVGGVIFSWLPDERCMRPFGTIWNTNTHRNVLTNEKIKKKMHKAEFLPFGYVSLFIFFSRTLILASKTKIQYSIYKTNILINKQTF